MENRYNDILLDVGKYYVLYNGNQPFKFVKKCRIVEIGDKVYIDRYEYDSILNRWKFSWYAICVMITHCMRDVCKQLENLRGYLCI